MATASATRNLFGVMILVVVAIALAPTMFDGADNITGAPTWVNTVLPLAIGAFLVGAIYAYVKF